ncbi:MAG: secretin N-terminal domain-containing protein [Waddliaceae bacterium]
MSINRLITFSILAIIHGSLPAHGAEANPFDNDYFVIEESTNERQTHSTSPSSSFFAIEEDNIQEDETLHTQSISPFDDDSIYEFEYVDNRKLETPTPDHIAQNEPQAVIQETPPGEPNTILINFTNVDIVELIRFVSRISNKNFIFDENQLNFQVTIISEEPTTVDHIVTALLQELRINGFQVIEQGNNLIIHPLSNVRSISRIQVEGEPESNGTELVTQVFRLNTLDPATASAIVIPLTSPQALIESSPETRHLIVTDLVDNVKKIAQLIRSLDSPSGGLTIGEYRVQSDDVNNLVMLTRQIMDPIVAGQTFQFVAHTGANRIFIISSPYLVERAISILEEVDRLDGETRILDLDRLRPTLDRAPGPLPVDASAAEGYWELGPDGRRQFRTPARVENGRSRPEGNWLLDPNGNWFFLPRDSAAPFGLRREGPQVQPGEQPRGTWQLAPDGSWVFQLAPTEQIAPARVIRESRFLEEAPVGTLERTKFYIHKLKYRLGAEIQDALLRISASLRPELINPDLIDAISTVQWIETSNSLIITGTGQAISRVRDLIQEVDVPLRQVFIEMLILDTTISDSLNFGVSWGSRSGGANTATSQGFIGGAVPLPQLLDTGGIRNGVVQTPDASIVARQIGYTLGVIGQAITHNGTQFSELAALVRAIHERRNSRIVLNPKIIAEDGVTAEIFVGLNVPYRTQSISNDEGSILTSNFEYRDVGTTLRVTPYLNSDDIITLEIEQESSSLEPITEIIGAESPGPTTRINRTRTRFHVPNEHFLVMSGMIDDQENKGRVQVPCLGGLPLIGWAFSDHRSDDTKRNLMLFIRPQIVNSIDEIRELTRHQQNVYKIKNHIDPSWKVEVDEAFEWININRDCCEQGCCD